VKPKPYFSEDGITIYHGDCREILPHLPKVDLVLTDPPYGIGYVPNHSRGEGTPWFDTEIAGDGDTSSRDWAVENFGHLPMLVFGTWKVPRPPGVRAVLIWDKGPHIGSGDLSFPWKCSHEEVYVLGEGWAGHRGESVLKGHWIVSWHHHPAGRVHPNQNPLSLVTELLGKAPQGLILDPFMGSGTTLLAAKQLGRRAIGIEIERRYCDIAIERLRQKVLPLSAQESRSEPSRLPEMP